MNFLIPNPIQQKNIIIEGDENDKLQQHKLLNEEEKIVCKKCVVIVKKSTPSPKMMGEGAQEEKESDIDNEEEDGDDCSSSEDDDDDSSRSSSKEESEYPEDPSDEEVDYETGCLRIYQAGQKYPKCYWCKTRRTRMLNDHVGFLLLCDFCKLAQPSSRWIAVANERPQDLPFLARWPV
jgi:hypothetical protein